MDENQEKLQKLGLLKATQDIQNAAQLAYRVEALEYQQQQLFGIIKNMQNDIANMNQDFFRLSGELNKNTQPIIEAPKQQVK